MDLLIEKQNLMSWEMNMEYKEKNLVHFQPKVHGTYKILHMKTFVKSINVKIAMKMKII